jgi:hypothetical protein
VHNYFSAWEGGLSVVVLPAACAPALALAVRPRNSLDGFDVVVLRHGRQAIGRRPHARRLDADGRRADPIATARRMALAMAGHANERRLG